MVIGCSKTAYVDRLCYTGLISLEDRRNRGDLLEVFKFLKGFNNVDYRKYFKLVENSRTRGHEYKIEKKQEVD